ncbi:MAG: tetratricopeptide repeat protein [Phycisphaerales bacterium]|nr:MAG: tetratricopeptide repeat protein [Phycisphaerales bacterium]
MPSSKRRTPTSAERRLDKPRAEVPGGRHRYAVVAASVLLCALIIRIPMLAGALNANPMLEHPQNDAHVYWEMAGRIAGGDLVDDKPFLSVPLYPYLLGLLRAFGVGLTGVYVLQLLIHLVTAGLIGLLAARKTDRVVGLTAAIVFLLLQEPAFFAARLLPSTIQLLVVTLTILAADRYACHGGRGSAAVFGALVGLLCLIYPPAMLLVPFVFVWLWWFGRTPQQLKAGSEGKRQERTSQRTDAKRWHSSGLVAGLLAAVVGIAVISPATIHNFAACGEFIPITAHAGITFRQGNAPESDGVYTCIEGISPLRERMHEDAASLYAARTGRQGGYREVDRYYLHQGLGFLASNPAKAFRLVAQKVYWFFSGRHYYDYDHLSLERAEGIAPFSYLAPVPTAWLMGPGLLGVFLIARRGRFSAFDAAMLILPLVIVAGFWFSPRYRLPVIPLLCVTTAAAIVYAVRDVRAEARKPGPIIGVILLTAASIATGGINHAKLFDRMESSITSYVDNLWRLYDETGDYEAAVDHFQRLQQRFPDHPRLFPGVVQAYLGKIAMTQQRWAEAEEAFARCLQIDPQNAAAHSGRWWVLTQLGRRQEAIPDLIEAVRLDPNEPLSALGYGIHLAEQGQLEAAEKQLRHAITLTPDEPKAYFNLAMVLKQVGRPKEGVPFLQEALRLKPAYTRARQLLKELESE